MKILEPYVGGDQEATTLPPPVRDIKFNITQSKENTDGAKDLVKITFMYNKEDFDSFSYPNSFEIKITDESKSTHPSKIISSKSNINLPIESCTGNLLFNIKAVNNIGVSLESFFRIPFFRSIRVLFDSKLDIFLKEERVQEFIEKKTLNNKSRIFLLYKDVLQTTIDNDYIKFNDLDLPNESDRRKKLKSRVSLNSTDVIVSNLRFDQFDPTFPFTGTQDGIFYFDKTDTINGWIYSTKEDIELYNELKDILDEYFEEYRLNYRLTTEDPFIMKFIWTHPVETNDSVIIYYMNQKGFEC